MVKSDTWLPFNTKEVDQTTLMQTGATLTQIESRCTEVTFPRLYSKSKAQQRLNPRSSKLPLFSQTIALFFLLAIKNQLKGYSMAARTCSATSPLVRSTTERENPLPLWDGKKAEGNSTVLLTRREGKQRGFIFCLYCEEMSTFPLLTARLSPS